MRREVVGISICGCLSHLYKALPDATLEICVCKPECDAQFVRQRSLGNTTVFMDSVQQTERDTALRVNRLSIG